MIFSTPKLLTRQRGSVVVYTGVTLLAILVAAVIAIEMGRVYGANRSLQKMASLAALDAVREASRCSRTLAPTQAELEARVNDSLERNGVLSEIRQVTVEPGTVQFDRTTGRRFLEPSTLDEATAVRVTLRRPFPALLTGLMPGTDKLMIVSATAEQPLSGAFEVGSGLAGLNGGMLNGILSALLGGNVNLSLVDYNGLAGVNVTLEQLATALDVDVHDLSDPLALQAQAPLLRDSLQGLSDALGTSASSTVVNLLRGLATSAATNTGTTTLDQVLGSYDLTGTSAPVVNLLDLLLDLAASTRADPSGTGTVIPLNVNTLGVNVGNLAVSAVGLRVLEAPKAGRGRPGDDSATASTAQIRLMVRAQVDASSVTGVIKPLLGLLAALATVDVTPMNIGIDVDVAKATAFLDRIDCPQTGVNNGMPQAYLSAQPAVATVRLGSYTGVPATFPAIATGSSQLLGIQINLIGGALAAINLNLFLANPVSTTAGSGTELPLPLAVTQFDAVTSSASSIRDVWIARGVPPAAAVTGNPQTVGSSNILRGTMTTLFNSLNITASDPAHGAGSSICLLKVLGLCTLSLPVDTLVNAVLPVVKGVLGTVLTAVGGIVDALLDPLLKALGVQIGTATVIMQSVTTDQPQVVTICRPDLPSSAARGCPTP